MAASYAVVKQRVTEILNACAAGTFSATVSASYLDRNADAITEAIREGAMMIGRAILANPKHVHRNVFISGTPTALTHQGELPDMAGEIDLIEIQHYNGGSFLAGTPRTVQQIESYRANPSSVYNALAHTTQNSPLAGFYAIEHGRVYFTGYAAQGYFPVISRADSTGITAQIPDEYEDVWTCLGVGLSVKEGDNLLPVAQHYWNIGMQGLGQITSMSVVAPMPPVEKALNARGDI